MPLNPQQFREQLQALADRLRWAAASARELASDPTPDGLVAWARGDTLAGIEADLLGLAIQTLDVQPPEVDAEPGGWADLYPEAIRALKDAMREGEHREAIAAAKEVIARVEGKVPQRIQVDRDTGGDLLDSPFWRFVANMVLHYGITFAEAERRAHADPEGVRAWAGRVGLLEGGEVGGARVALELAPPPGAGG